MFTIILGSLECHVRDHLSSIPNELQAGVTALFNLGQVFRRQKEFQIAVKCFQACLVFEVASSSTLTALAFTHQLSGSYSTAIELYHKTLSIKPGDTFASEMLSRALVEALDDDKSLERASFSASTLDRDIFSPVRISISQIVVTNDNSRLSPYADEHLSTSFDPHGLSLSDDDTHHSFNLNPNQSGISTDMSTD